MRIFNCATQLLKQFLGGRPGRIDVTDDMHSTFRDLAVRLTQDMGLRSCGVDLMVMESISEPCSNQYWVLEMNSAPGLDHYADIGKRQKGVVDELYLKVLRAMKELS